jgi:hypothetical protein
MKLRLLLIAGITILSTVFSSCKKSSTTSNTCSLSNGYLRCNDGVRDFCADGTLTANQIIVMSIKGTTSDSASLSMELSSLTPGNYQITDALNPIEYTNVNKVVYESTSDTPGSLVILANDTANKKITGTFTALVREHTLNSTLTLKTGTFSVTYTK